MGLTKEQIMQIRVTYEWVFNLLNSVLIGQENVRHIVASSILCDKNSKILLTGNTASGKTTLSNYFANLFKSQRISVTSDLIPSDILEQLQNKTSIRLLHIDEFNRGSGKVHTAFNELFEEHQISLGGVKYSFNDFYVFLTQNISDISGIFPVPQASYDKIDVNVYFEKLAEKYLRTLLFDGFEAAKPNQEQGEAFLNAISITTQAVKNFEMDEADKDVIIQAINLLDSMTIHDELLFGSDRNNIRAHKFMLKLAKLAALVNGRGYLLATDIVDFVQPVYGHRIDQNIAKIGADEVVEQFNKVEGQILEISRKK